MRAAVIGLGVEGKKASKSLLDHGWKIYASDLKTTIDLEELAIPITDAQLFTDDEKVNIFSSRAIIDLGYLDMDEIDDCDAIMLSPSLWNSEIAKKMIKSDKLISDYLSKHKDICTIGITGTNGKTTTALILKEILENYDKKVLIGGNAGGGFEGYCDVFLEAEKGDYDVIIVEVCDMTLDFCDYAFDFDLIGITNIGNDHINVHGSIENYKNSLLRFSENKTTFINEDVAYFSEFKDPLIYTQYPEKLKLFGDFNKLNAGLAYSIAKNLNVPDDIIDDTLKNFKAVEGRLKIIKINDARIFIGKSDNSDAVKAILKEEDFYATFIGTPRADEEHRFEILDEVAKYAPEVIVLFPGLDDTIDQGVYKLKYLGYEGRIEIVNSFEDIIKLIIEFSHEKAIFIGGNGQKLITNIQKRLELLSKTCS